MKNFKETNDPKEIESAKFAQLQMWRDFYEEAWSVRAALIEDFLQTSNNNPFVAIQKLRGFERTHDIVFRGDASSSWTSRTEDARIPVLPTGVPAFRLTAADETVRLVPSYDSIVSFLLDYLQDFKFDAIVELGCGFGQNLIELFYRGGPQTIPYYAGEMTDSGRKLSLRLAEKAACDGMRLRPFHFDYLQPDLSAVKEKGNILVFTSHSIEQVKYLPASLLEVISRHAQKVVCMHFEPFGFQLSRSEFPSAIHGDVSQAQEKLFRDRQFNLNLVDLCIRAHQRQEISIQSIFKNVFYADLDSPTSLLVWSNEANSQSKGSKPYS